MSLKEDPSDLSHPQNVLLSKYRKFLYTVTMYSVYLIFGMASSLRTSARLDISELTGSTFSAVSYGTAVLNVGYVLGAVASAWLYKKFNRHLGLSSCILLLSLSIFMVPFCRVLWSYYVCEFGFGVTAIGIDIAINAWLLEIWQAGSNPFMQGLHSCYAIGYAVGPLYEEPFLSPDRNETMVNTAHPETRIQVPFSIATGLLLLVAGLLLVIHCLIPYTDPRRRVAGQKESGCDHQSQTGKEDKQYYTRMIFLGSLLLCFYIGLEISTLNFLPEFLHVTALRLTKSKALFMASVTSGILSACCVISAFVATKLPSQQMMYASFAALMAGNLILLVFANTSEIMLWIACMALGVGHSCMKPCIISFLEEMMNVTTTVCSIFFFSSCIPNIITPILIGRYVEQIPMSYVYLNLSSLIVCAGIFSAIFVVDHRFRRE